MNELCTDAEVGEDLGSKNYNLAAYMVFKCVRCGVPFHSPLCFPTIVLGGMYCPGQKWFVKTQTLENFMEDNPALMERFVRQPEAAHEPNLLVQTILEQLAQDTPSPEE